MGQFDPLEEVLTDYAYGFPKRFHEVWNSVTQVDEGQACEDSIEFLQSCHEFMAVKAYPNPGQHHPDGYASDFGKAVLAGVEDFIQDNPTLNRRIKEALAFTDTHYMRIANAVMRACQQLEAMAPFSSQQAGNRMAWNVWESAHALHNIFRLWEFQFGHAGAMFEHPDDAPAGPQLSQDSWLQRAMLACPKWKGGASISSAVLREALKHDMKRKQIQQPSKALLRAADGLVEAGLVQHIEAPVQAAAPVDPGEAGADVGEPKPKKQKMGGWPCKSLRKKLWPDISTSQVAMERLRVLGVGSDHFEA